MEEKIYCYKCGRKLIKKIVFDHFNEKTREKIYHTILKCPNTWFCGHNKYEFDENLEEVINYY